MCQPRVKTFEELPLEMHPQKAPQVSSSSPTSIVEKMWTGCWHFANAIRLWKSSPQIITKNSRCTQQRSSSGVSRRHLIHMMSHCVSFPGQPDGQRDGSGLRGIWENRTSAQGCRPQKVNHTKSWWSIFLSETEIWGGERSRLFSLTVKQQHADVLEKAAFMDVSESCVTHR